MVDNEIFSCTIPDDRCDGVYFSGSDRKVPPAHGWPFGPLFIEIGRFMCINAECGHNVGE